MENSNDKPFKALDYKYNVQIRIYKETENLSNEELKKYFRNSTKSGYFGKWLKEIKIKNVS